MSSVHGMVLSGGGAFAAFEVGVLKAMAFGAMPIEIPAPDVIAGTSSGSLNAAIVLSQPNDDFCSGVQTLEDIWLNRIADKPGRSGNGVYRVRFDLRGILSPSGVLSFCTSPLQVLDCAQNLLEDTSVIFAGAMSRALSILAGPRSLLREITRQVDLSSLVSIQPYATLIRQILHPVVIQRSRRRLMIIVTDWESGRLRVFHNADMTESQAHLIIQASGAVPGLFPAVRIGDFTGVDGALVMNAPIQPVIEAGADVISLVELCPAVSNSASAKSRGTMDTIERMFAAASDHLITREIEMVGLVNRELDDQTGIGDGHRQKRRRKISIHRFRPSCALGTLTGRLNVTRDAIQKLIAAGFQSARDHNCQESKCVLA